MVQILEGLTKNQVKQIIRIAKKKELSGREPLQGLLYQADYKYLFVTDGYTAVSWDMGNVLEDILPKEDVRISYQSLNAWCANAKAKDVLKWDEIFALAKSELVPNMHSLIDKFCYTGELPAPRINPTLISEIMPLFLSPVDISIIAQYKNDTPALKLTADESNLGVKFNQLGLIMGLKKRK